MQHQRIAMLIESSRFEMAERELRQVIGQDPGDDYAHALLALSLAKQERFDEATTEARQAISLAPDESFNHYVYSRVMFFRNRYDESLTAINSAIALEPDDADYHAQASNVYYSQSRWKDALNAAQQGLQHDPESEICANLRAMALVKMGRNEAATKQIKTTLARDPENALSHANMGWTLLEKGESRKAIEHFEQALRIDPTSQFAKSGMVEAIKARNPVYRMMLGYFLWMAKFTGGMQFAIILGAYIGFQFLRGVARNYPDWAPFINPILILYIAFCVISWLAIPVSNLILRLHPKGRLALTRDQVRTSNWVGALILAAIIFLAGYFATGFGDLLRGALMCAFMIPPVTGLFACEHGWPRTTMIVVTGILGVLAVFSFTMGMGSLAFSGDAAAPMGFVSSGAFILFVIGAIGSQFAANSLMMAEPAK